MARVLVTGMSGTGKSSALAELERRGHRVVECDWPGWMVPSPAGDEMVIDEARMDALLAEPDPRSLFVSAAASNQSRFYDRFDAIVLLSAPAEVILERVATRTTNPYGTTPEQRAEILDHLGWVEPLLRHGATREIDTRRPLAEVVAELERIAAGV
jgi:dephospho-CoA kinase